MKQNKMLGMALAGVAALSMLSFQAEAKTVQVTLHATEVDLPIDNKGTMYRTWTFDGGTSCHYSRDRELMFRIIASELAKSRLISPVPA